MATYGRGQMLGSGINPESFKLDYSGMANAAATQARGVANLGASIGGAISEVGDYFKKQAEDEKKVQKSLSVAKAIGDLIPGLKPTIEGSLNILNDKEIPLSQRTAEADAIEDILNLGINEVRNRQDVGFKERELGIREAEALARNAASQRSVNLQLGEVRQIINGKPYDVKVTFNPATGETRRLDGSLVSAGFRDSAIIDTGLNLPMPTAEGTAMPGDGTFPYYGSISDAIVLPPKVDPAAIAAAAELTGGQIDVSNVPPMPMGTPTTTQTPVVNGIPTGQAGAGMIPPGATPIEEKPEESYRPFTPKEITRYGSDGQVSSTGKVYPIRLPSGTEFTTNPDGSVIYRTGSGFGGKNEKAEVERKKQQSSFVDEFTKTAAETIKLLPNLPDNPVGAKFGAVLGEILPGTEQGRVVSRLNTIKANLALDKINQMRAASPTGGAAGTMTVQEWPLFMQEFGSLDAAENKQDLEARLKNASVKLFNRVNGTPEERQSALEKGIITKEQNEIVQKQYDGMLSTLGASVPKSPASSIPRSEEIEAIRKKYLTPNAQ